MEVVFHNTYSALTKFSVYYPNINTSIITPLYAYLIISILILKK